MKKKLSIAEIILALLALLLPCIDGMFTWITYNMFENISKTKMSLYNLMTIQRIAPGPVVYWIFNIVTLLMIAYCVYSLFDEKKFDGKKALISIPAVSFLSNLIMIIAADNHNDTFKYNGEYRNIAVSMDLLAYIEIAIVLAIVVIECYKQYKCE